MQERETNALDGKAEIEQAPAPPKPLRLWPGVVIAVVLVLVRYGLLLIAPDAELGSFPLALIAVFGGMLGAAAIAVWWLFFSRAAWSERLGALALMIAAVFATRFIVHESIRGGMMGGLLFIYSIPVLGLALVVWAVATQRLPAVVRRVALVAAILLACTPWVLLRTAGSLGVGSDFHWRWTPTPEQLLLAQANDEPPPTAPMPAASLEPPKETPTVTPAATPAASPTASATVNPESAAPAPAQPAAEWPGFRGPRRDSVIRGVQIKTDWTAAPPVELWRRPIGPGWSSFAVRGDLLYTQEQRGDEELVACYKVSTGEPVWRHRDPVRFWESNGGAGPRATPALSGNRVYTFGATGVLNALDASTGKVVWSRNAATDTDRKVPDWGFASSPLVAGEVVIVAVSGTLAAYDSATGKARWVGPAHGGSYSSPHRTTIDGVAQVLLLHSAGATSVAPASGEVLWEYAWPGSAIVQPTLLANGDILISTGGAAGGLGTRRLAVTHEPGAPAQWAVAERWTSIGLKPYFNDFVAHQGHAFGFDGNILACINLADGKRQWKGGRYGNGQLVLLADQDLLLVLSEEGELALVSATTAQFKELARFRALEGKTWNHPVVVGDVLLARNGEQMAAFRLPRADR
jgi:outer membrane protein assembly factor BamB